MGFIGQAGDFDSRLELTVMTLPLPEVLINATSGLSGMGLLAL
jgi:hypothetical protein